MMKTIRGFCAASIFLFTACPDKETESASGSETTTGAPTTSGATEPTTAEATTTDATATGPTTTEDVTTGGEALCDVDMAAFEATCDQVCDVYGSCEADVDPVACAESCKTDTLFKDTPACLCNATAWNACRGALDCDGIDKVGFVASAPCFVEGASYLIHCGDCHVEPQFLAEDVCVTGIECPDVLGVSFLCQDGTCTCSDGEQDFASCPDPGVCAGMDAAALNAAATECCGVPF